jgi:hypothetical protein
VVSHDDAPQRDFYVNTGLFVPEWSEKDASEEGEWRELWEMSPYSLRCRDFSKK